MSSPGLPGKKISSKTRSLSRIEPNKSQLYRLRDISRINQAAETHCNVSPLGGMTTPSFLSTDYASMFKEIKEFGKVPRQQLDDLQFAFQKADEDNYRRLFIPPATCPERPLEAIDKSFLGHKKIQEFLKSRNERQKRMRLSQQ